MDVQIGRSIRPIFPYQSDNHDKNVSQFLFKKLKIRGLKDY